jgi:hypothetical protein
MLRRSINQDESGKISGVRVISQLHVRRWTPNATKSVQRLH